MFSNNNSKSKGKNNAGREDKDNAGQENNNNTSGEGENNTGGNNKTLNIKLRIKNLDKKSNLGEISASKLALDHFAYLLIDTFILNTVFSDYFTIPLIISLIFFVSGSFAFDCVTSCFLVPSALHFVFFAFFIIGLPIFPCFGFFIIFLINLNTFFYNLFITFLVDGGTIKFLAEVFTNFFGNNPSVIIHYSYNGYIIDQTPNTSTKFEFANFFLSVNAIFSI